MITHERELSKLRGFDSRSQLLETAHPDQVREHARYRIEQLEKEIERLQESVKERRKELREWKKILGQK